MLMIKMKDSSFWLLRMILRLNQSDRAGIINFKYIFFKMGHQRPSNGEYITGEKDFFGHSWGTGKPSEDRPIKHRENTFMSIKIDRVIGRTSTLCLSQNVEVRLT